MLLNEIISERNQETIELLTQRWDELEERIQELGEELEGASREHKRRIRDVIARYSRKQEEISRQIEQQKAGVNENMSYDELMSQYRELKDELEYTETQIEREADMGGEEYADYEYLDQLEKKRKRIIQQMRELDDLIDLLDQLSYNTATMFTHTNVPQKVDITTKTVNGKRWYILPDGRKYPSITTVLSHKEKPGLEEWRQSLGPKKADKETKRCAERGDAVHLMAEHYLNNVENPIEGHQKQHARLFNQIKLHLNKINNIRAQELPLYSDTLKLAGRVDVVGEYENVLSIIDFKTSNNNKDTALVEDYFLQCTAYALMYEELYDEFIEDIVIVMAVEKGMIPLVYKRKIDDFVEPLVERINTFYKDLK